MSQVQFGLVTLLIAAFATASTAQTAVVGGTVYRDSAQHPIGGAEITIQPLNRATRTNYLGEFRVDKVPAGRYAVAIHYLGFAPFTDSITVTNGQVITASSCWQRQPLSSIRSASSPSGRPASRSWRSSKTVARWGSGISSTRRSCAKSRVVVR